MTVKASLNQQTKKNTKGVEGVVVGMLSGFNAQGLPLVIFPGNPKEIPLTARSMAACSQQDIGREAALLFEGGDPEKPLLVGLIQNPENQQEVDQSSQIKTQEIEEDAPSYLELDGERIELKAKQQITIKCGRASITLTQAGKILVRGTYLSNRSSGVNRIKGGSVQIN